MPKSTLHFKVNEQKNITLPLTFDQIFECCDVFFKSLFSLFGYNVLRVGLAADKRFCNGNIFFWLVA